MTDSAIVGSVKPLRGQFWQVPARQGLAENSTSGGLPPNSQSAEDCPERRKLCLWAEITCNHHRLGLQHAPAEFLQERRSAADQFLSFLSAAVFPMVAGLGLGLAERMKELQAQIDKTPAAAGKCEDCKAARAVEALACAMAKQRAHDRAAGLKGGAL